MSGDPLVNALKENISLGSLTRRVGRFNDAWYERMAGELRAALASETTDAGLDRWFTWLIERGQPEGVSPSLYYRATHDEYDWTPDPWRAIQISEREEAKRLIELNGIGPARAVEHGFSCSHEDARCGFCNRRVVAALSSGSIDAERLARAEWAEEPAATPTVRDYGFWREFERVDSV